MIIIYILPIYKNNNIIPQSIYTLNNIQLKVVKIKTDSIITENRRHLLINFDLLIDQNTIIKYQILKNDFFNILIFHNLNRYPLLSQNDCELTINNLSSIPNDLIVSNSFILDGIQPNIARPVISIIKLNINSFLKNLQQLILNITLKYHTNRYDLTEEWYINCIINNNQKNDIFVNKYNQIIALSSFLQNNELIYDKIILDNFILFDYKKLNIIHPSYHQLKLENYRGKIENLADPINDFDAVNKRYVENLIDETVRFTSEINLFKKVMEDDEFKEDDDDIHKIGLQNKNFYELNKKTYRFEIDYDPDEGDGEYSARLSIDLVFLPVGIYTMVFEIFIDDSLTVEQLQANSGT